jgi:ATP-dependent DNA helicase PIF1
VSEDPNDVNIYPARFLHTQTPSGFPPHVLLLKPRTVVMLIRNLNPKKGLCNGTRMIVRDLHTRFITCEIISESHRGDVVFIPRIDIAPSDSQLPFTLKRRQLPIIPAFAITINKSQGQTYDHVGISLNELVISNGQLYVALS